LSFSLSSCEYPSSRSSREMNQLCSAQRLANPHERLSKGCVLSLFGASSFSCPSFVRMKEPVLERTMELLHPIRWKKLEQNWTDHPQNAAHWFQVPGSRKMRSVLCYSKHKKQGVVVASSKFSSLLGWFDCAL
jgi:hypothetical protein